MLGVARAIGSNALAAGWVVPVPKDLLGQQVCEGRPRHFLGDLRAGDLDGSGALGFVLWRAAPAAEPLIPCFLAAFTASGRVLWQAGRGGVQPCRPGPVALHDLDGPAVLSLWQPEGEGLELVRREGRTGALLCSAAPEALVACRGEGANWVHQRLLLCDLRGTGAPRDLVLKRGDTVLALEETGRVLWQYTSPWTAYGRCGSYIPATGDIDGDGCDEVLGGYWLLDQDGTVLWDAEALWGDGPPAHLDSVAIAPWDSGQWRAVCSGYGTVLDSAGGVVLQLGADCVPHGQEVRVGRFAARRDEVQMVLRYNGHRPDLLVAGADGTVCNRFVVEPTVNNTGMEVVRWLGAAGPDLLFDGTRLWEPLTGRAHFLPGLPARPGWERMDWYHCIPIVVADDGTEGMVLYSPWATEVYIYLPAHVPAPRFRPTLRTANARLMD